jgi:hypothetical protein
LSSARGPLAIINHIAFDKNASSVDVSKKSVVLVAIEVKRFDDSRFQPIPNVRRNFLTHAFM